ncbi:MAG: ZIP family metal transporter [Candidatus Helarchaeota archaeon]
MVDFFPPILISFIAGAATAIGGILGIYKRLSMKYFDLVVGFAAGVMIAVATFGLIDESIALLNDGTPALLIAAIVISGVGCGMMLLLVLDKFLPHLHALLSTQDHAQKMKELVCSRECKCPNTEKWFECPYLENGKCITSGGCLCPKRLDFQRHMKYSGLLLAIGLTLHNAPEGIAVGVGFLATAGLGFSLAFAIALHNIPEGLAIAVPLMQGKYSRTKILLITFFSGMAEPLACIMALFLLQAVSPLFLSFFLAFAGGAMLYITSDELIPESHAHGFEHQASIGLTLGIILMLVLTIVFQI